MAKIVKQYALESLKKALLVNRYTIQKAAVRLKRECPAPTPDYSGRAKRTGRAWKAKRLGSAITGRASQGDDCSRCQLQGLQYREANTRAGAEEPQVEGQTGATRNWQAVVREAQVHQTTPRERLQDLTAGGEYRYSIRPKANPMGGREEQSH